MEFSVQLSRVEILQELFHLPRNPDVLIIGEEVHVAEGVNCNQWKIVFRLAEVAERVSKFEPVGNEEVHAGFLRHQLSLDQLSVFLHTRLVLRLVEENEEGKSLLSQLLGIFKGDFSDQRRAVLLCPSVKLVVIREDSCERLKQRSMRDILYN